MAAMSGKNMGVIIGLVAVGVIIIALTFTQKPQPSQSVTMQDVFRQTPVQPAVDAVAGEEAKNADPIPAPAIITTPEMGQEAGFTVQVYSFQDRTRAERAMDALKSAGYKAYMEVSDLGPKGTWYRVRIGGLENEAQAKAMLDEVRKNYQSGFIVKPQS